MHPRWAWSLLALLSASAGGSAAATGGKDAEKTTSTTTMMPCTATGASGSFYDLRPDIAVKPEEGVKPKKGVVVENYKARGWDYGYNFTFNICAPVVKPPERVYGVRESLWKNISMYYEHKDNTYSLGQFSSVLKSRGRKLVLQYKDGSPCESPSSSSYSSSYYRRRSSTSSSTTSSSSHSTSSKSSKGKDTDPDNSKARRKSATISFICDRDPLNTVAAPSFVSADPDECAYFFEVRSIHACAGAEPHKPGSVGPGPVFAIILLIAVMVYVVGGVFYQRTVAHARGWRQLPNYSLWAGIWGFVKDFFIIITASCTSLLPGRRGYQSISRSPTGRGRNREDENRLIDQLDEEWDD